MPLASPDLDAAFEACRRETAEWAKTFYIGTLLLPPEKRRAIWAIYVWCRRTDELMDSPEAQARPVEELAERLDRWEEKTRALFEGRVEDDLDAVMVDTLERFPQGIQPYLDMIEGQRMDLTWTRYPRFEDLKLYCYRVAGTVGLMTRGGDGRRPGLHLSSLERLSGHLRCRRRPGDRQPTHQHSSGCWGRPGPWSYLSAPGRSRAFRLFRGRADGWNP